MLLAAKRADFFFIGFDESMIVKTKTGQMMNLHLRFWERGEIRSHYYISRALVHARAVFIVQQFSSFQGKFSRQATDAILSLQIEKILLQIVLLL